MSGSSLGGGASGDDSESRLDDLLGAAFQAERACPGEDLAGTGFGPYVLRERIGHGGMGEVYLAEQSAPVSRRVAVKLVRAGGDSIQLRARFRRERNALARLGHRNVATVLDAGTTPSGRPFVVMELLSGANFVEYCERRGATLDERLALLAEVCDGVQHAHEHGVIHRDLKPSNVLVTQEDGRAVPKIIDFGLASALDEPAKGWSWHTRPGAVLGTLDFMSPEQAEGAADLDTRTDVYALGALLYETLCGERPLHGLATEDPLRAQRRIVDEVPPPPSRRLLLAAHADQIARRRGTTTKRLARRLRGDLDAIAGKALQKEREERYASAAELAADLRAHLRGEPVSAGTRSVLASLLRTVRRRKLPFAALALVLALLVAWIATNLVLARRARVATSDEVAARRVADEHLARFHRLSGIERLRSAERELGTIFPPIPARADALQAWLTANQDLTSEFPADLRATIANLRVVNGFAPDRAPAEAVWPRAADRFLHDTLSGLVTDLERFAQREYRLAREDLAWAQSVHERTVERHRDAWSRCLATTPSLPAPQLGLVPLGPDPESGLQEFYDPRSSADPERIPRRDAANRLERFADMGVVFVLVPEGEVRGERIAPFLLGKFELTQAQWARITHGSTPSLCPPDVQGRRDTTNPVDNVDLVTCREVLMRQGWSVPSESAWEHACRAGRTEPATTLPDRAELVGAANLADRTAHASNKAWSHEPWLEDGYVLSAPVGSFRPNRFGLHDMLGNVAEWCEGGHGDEPVSRGGSYVDLADASRWDARRTHPRDHKASTIGVRPLRGLAAR